MERRQDVMATMYFEVQKEYDSDPHNLSDSTVDNTKDIHRSSTGDMSLWSHGEIPL